jgi:hypothetical protein
MLTILQFLCALLHNLGARMSVSDETLTILAKNQTVLERVQEKVLFLFCVLFSHLYLSLF